MEPLEIYFPLEAKGKQRPRASTVNGRARLYTPKQTQDEEYTVASLAYQQIGQPLLEAALDVEIYITVRPPKSWSNKKRAAALAQETRPTSKPDLDNVAKLYLDALNGIVWVDDKQIAELKVVKRWGEKAGVSMVVQLA